MKRILVGYAQPLAREDRIGCSNQKSSGASMICRNAFLFAITCLMLITTSRTTVGMDGVMAADTTEVLAALDSFHEALARGDSASVADLLSSNVFISEGGKIESKEEYLSGHFHGDSAYLSAMAREPISRMVTIRGETAWVVSKTRLHGTFRDREIDSNSVETVVLIRSDGHWVIAAIHWSSGRRG